jgi:uncharacterized membrane protein YedE/YeeE
MKNISALVAGIVFGFGLVVSGMSDPANVLAFLTLNQAWNPALIMVMGSAVAVTTVGYLLARRRAAPLWGPAFNVPENKTVDSRLIIGSGLFGVGWGLSGYCPGPALVAGFQLDVRALAFVACFLIGFALYEFFLGRRLVTELSSTMVDG